MLFKALEPNVILIENTIYDLHYHVNYDNLNIILIPDFDNTAKFTVF